MPLTLKGALIQTTKGVLKKQGKVGGVGYQGYGEAFVFFAEDRGLRVQHSYISNRKCLELIMVNVLIWNKV